MLPLPLLQKIEQVRGDIWEEHGKLKFRLPEDCATELIEEMKMQKANLLKALQLEKQLKNMGWLTLSRWEAYEKRMTANHSIFLFHDPYGWMIWRATWQPGRSAPVREKVMGKDLTFEEAVQSANSYIHWFTNKRPA